MQKCSQDAADADVIVGCDSAPPHPVRCPAKGGDFCKGGGATIHCLITKICELGACFLYFSYVLAQNGG